MAALAVVAKRDKTLGPGLDALRARLTDLGHADAAWFEIDKSRQATKRVRRAVSDGAETVLVWGGDGTVQRAIDALVDQGAGDVSLGVLPAGTANLFANNFDIPIDLDGALDVALNGQAFRIDVGRVNGEHFGVMAGTGFDARMIRDASSGLKDRLGRLAYVFTGARNLRESTTEVQVRVDDEVWFDGPASCVLVGNVGRLFGGLEVFPDADVTDGLLEVGVVRAENVRQWGKLLTDALHDEPQSGLLMTTRGAKVDVRLADAQPYELDGGDRDPTKRLRARVVAGAVTLRVPHATAAGSVAARSTNRRST